MSLRDYFTQTLKKDEAIVAIVRKHWVTFVVPLVIALLVTGLLIGFVDFFFRNEIGMYIWFALIAAVLLYATYHWLMHYFDSFIITDYRIIDIDQHGLFKRTVSETTFDKVQDVTYSIVGMLATGMDYGTVSVATASSTGKIELDHVPHPRKVHEIVLEAQRLFKQRHGGDMTAQELVELIARTKTKKTASAQAAQQDVESAADEEGGDSEEEASL